MTNIRGETTAEKLMKFFSFTRLVRLLSDVITCHHSGERSGNEIKSGVKAIYSAAFQLLSHESVVRVQLTIRNILRKFIMENREWDRRTLPFILLLHLLCAKPLTLVQQN